MEPEIVKADPVLRRNFTILSGIIVLGALALIYFLSSWLRTISSVGDIKSLLRILQILLPAMAIISIRISIWMIKLARTIISEAAYPPLNQKVIKDTPRVYGKAALQKAYILIALAIILVLGTVSSSLLAYRIADSFI